MPNTFSRTRRAVVGWVLTIIGALIPFCIGLGHPEAQAMQQRIDLLFLYDWLYGLAVAMILLGLPLALSE